MTASVHRVGPVATIFRHYSIFVLWFVPAAVLSVALARAAVFIQLQGFASALSPLVVGLALGAVTAWLARSAGQRGRAVLVVGTFFLALLCVATEHLLFYLDYRIKIVEAAEKDPKLEIFQAAGELPVPTFGEFLRAQAPIRPTPTAMPNWLWWIVDASLTIVGAIGISYWFTPATRAVPTSGLAAPIP